MATRERALWALAIVSSVALLLAPALWNGFPLLEYDTGGYLARWYEHTLVISRAVVYGLMLNAGAPLAFWPVLVVQSALTVWLIALVLRAHALGRRPLLLLGVVAVLTVFTTLPWLTAILLTDIFAGLGVLALYLLLLRAETLSARERLGLIALTAVSAATHSATFAVLLGLLIAAALYRSIGRTRPPWVRLGHGLIALVLGAALVFAADYAVAGRLAWTPGGFSLSFGRMLQDGIVKKYLDAHCPDPRLRLCAYKDQLPDNADVWFWGSALFNKLGRFEGLGPEMETIALGALADYPGLQLAAAARDTALQLIDVRTGEGVLNSIWHTYGIIERYTPPLLPAMRAARQQKGEISFAALNRLHYPVALLSMLLLLLLLLLLTLLPTDIGEFCAACALALLGNAFVCGALANPHDRYGARMVWLAALAVMVAFARLAQDRLGRARNVA